ncbi:MAG: hypothetical protein DGJ47_000356 [Rickettsiaceae bacterium]
MTSDFLVKNASIFGSSIALVSNDTYFTYTKLYKEVCKREYEIKNSFDLSEEYNGKVAIIRRKSKFLAIIDILAVMQMGYAFLYIPVDYPEERFLKIISLVKPQLIITDQNLIIRKDYARYTNDLAYLIYTSGSTGASKAVMVTHKNLENFICNLQKAIPTLTNTVMLQYSNLTFYAIIWEIFATLMFGGTLVISEHQILDTAALTDFINLYKINRALLTPIIANGLLKNDTALQDLIIGGDVFKSSFLKDWTIKYNLWNAYGPTEGTVCVLLHKFQSKSEAIVLGTPLYKDALRLDLESDELVIYGAQVAYGHINDKGIKLYHGVFNTGDLVQKYNNSYIFKGRKDHQIKVRGGYRVSIEEIKNTIESIEGVEFAFVCTQHPKTLYPELYCFYSGKINQDVLRNKMNDILPKYMMPTFITAIDVWPLNKSGKIDKDHLIDTYSIKSLKKNHISEEQIIAIWSAILGHNNIVPEDNFFSIGGGSFAALQVIEAYLKEFGIAFELTNFFITPVLKDQLKIIINSKESKC